MGNQGANVKTAVIYNLRIGWFDTEHGQSFVHIFTRIIPLFCRLLIVWVDLLFLCADNCVDKPLEGLPSVTRGGVPNYHFRGQVFNVKKMCRSGLLCLPNPVSKGIDIETAGGTGPLCIPVPKKLFHNGGKRRLYLQFSDMASG